MPPTWNEGLSLQLSQLRAEVGKPPRVAVVGVGNAMRSDDAAGVVVAHALLQRSLNRENILILEAGQAPENWTGELRAFAPVLVLFIDAADLGEAPGTIQWIAEETIDGMSASTHSLPLSMLAYYLKLELACDVIFLGIQIDSNEVGRRVSPDVLGAVKQIVEELDRLLRAG